MIIQNISALSRLLGVGVCLLSTWVSGREAAPAFVLLGLAAWSITAFGEWLWSFEEGWFGLQRGLRVVQAALIGGGMVCDAVFRIGPFYRIV